MKFEFTTDEMDIIASCYAWSRQDCVETLEEKKNKLTDEAVYSYMQADSYDRVRAKLILMTDDEFGAIKRRTIGYYRSDRSYKMFHELEEGGDIMTVFNDEEMMILAIHRKESREETLKSLQEHQHILGYDHEIDELMDHVIFGLEMISDEEFQQLDIDAYVARAADMQEEINNEMDAIYRDATEIETRMETVSESLASIVLSDDEEL